MTLPLAPSAPAACDAAHDAVGYELGRDHARHGVVPPAEHLHPFSPVCQGWQDAAGRFAQRHLRAERHVRRWLSLRLDAWRLGQEFDAQAVNAALLRRIDVRCCPITREALDDDPEAPSGAAPARANPLAAWAIGNVAILGRRAQHARGDRSAGEVMRIAQRFEAAPTQPIDDLTAEQWARLAVWCSFATPQAHQRAALLPLLVLPSPRQRVLNAVQALQVLLSLQVTRAGHARRCAALAASMPPGETRHAFNAFMHTLLARRLALGRIDDDAAERQAVEDLWRDPLLNRRWQRLALRLSDADCERLVRRALDDDFAGARLRWLPQAAATDGWAPGGSPDVVGAPAAAPAVQRPAGGRAQPGGTAVGGSIREAPAWAVASA